MPNRQGMESMKQIQIETQETRNFTESICSRLNKGKDKISDLEDRKETNGQEKKDTLKIT